MLRLATALVVLVALLFFAVPKEAASFSSGAPANRSGAPGESTCATAGCHSSFNLNSGSGSVTVTAPDTYGPGAAVTFSVAVDNTTDPSPERKSGFQVSVKDAAGADVGTLELVDPARTRFANSTQRHVTHTSQGSSTAASWEVRWIAPDPAPATVTIYAAGNAANGNGSPSGDFIYTTSRSLSLVGVGVDEHLPQALTLDAVWPNPTRGTATLSFALMAPTEVTVALLDGTGRQVALAHRGTLAAGPQTVNLSASGLAAGVYFAAVTTPAGRRVLPLTVAR